ncbi:MAG: hypothetical protein LH615_06915 [Ferruginibacter sp.]|nr:hypothetical protein [Ferruginibacter sp.]
MKKELPLNLSTDSSGYHAEASCVWALWRTCLPAGRVIADSRTNDDG